MLFKKQVFSTKTKPDYDISQAQYEQKISSFKYEVSVESNFARRLRLAATRAIVSHIVNRTNLPPGDYKIKFTPEEGSEFIPIFRQVRASDNCRFKIFEHNGHRVGEYSHKEFRSKIETERKQLGASPRNQAGLLYCSVDEAYNEIKRVLEKTPNLDCSMQSDLKKLLEITAERKSERAKLLKESCGDSEANYKRLQSLLDVFSNLICQINDLKNSTTKVSESEIPKDILVNAAYAWPMHPKFASSFVDFINKKYGGSKPLVDWVSRYAAQLKKAMGVDILEYSSYDMMRELEHAILRVGDDVGDDARKQNNFYGKANAVIFQLSKIKEAVAAIDKKTEKLASNSVFSESDLETICELGLMRSELLSGLHDLYNKVGELNNLTYNIAHLKMIVATMAVNLCKPGPLEHNLWKEMLQSPDFHHYLSKFRNEVASLKKAKRQSDKEMLKLLENQLKMLVNSINNYIEKCEKDLEKIRKANESAKIGRSPYTGKLALLEEQLQETLEKINGISPAVYKILSEAYANSKSHTEYKMGLPMCQDPNYYLAVSELLFSMASIKDFEPYRARFKQYLEQNESLYNMFEKWGLRNIIINHIDHFSYLKEKAFDFETDPASLLKSGFSGKTINVKYSVGMDPLTQEEMLFLKYENTIIQVKFPSKSYEQAGPYKKSVDEEFYGDKMGLDFFLGLEDGAIEKMGLGQIYSLFANAASNNTENYYKVQSLLRSRSMETAHFISTLNIKKRLSGCVSNMAGENLPKELHGNHDEFSAGLQKLYSNYTDESKETYDFILQKTNVRIFKELNRILPYLVRECARQIEKRALDKKADSSQ